MLNFPPETRREAWAALPLQRVVIPTLDAPVLAYWSRDEAAATLLAAEIENLYAQFRKAFTRERRRALAHRIRRAHLARVSLAFGVQLSGRPREVWEFTD